MKIHSQEQKEHYKNLEFSNLLLEKQTLEIQLSNKKHTSFKRQSLRVVPATDTTRTRSSSSKI